MTGIRNRFRLEKRRFQLELEEGIDDLLGLNPLPHSVLYWESEDELQERLYKEDIEAGLFEDHWDLGEEDLFDEYEPDWDDDYGPYDPNDDSYWDMYDTISYPDPGDHVRDSQSNMFVLTEDRKFVNLLTGKYANPWPYEIIWNGR